jgi:hypothetical protein
MFASISLSREVELAHPPNGHLQAVGEHGRFDLYLSGAMGVLDGVRHRLADGDLDVETPIGREVKIVGKPAEEGTHAGAFAQRRREDQGVPV